MYVFTWDRNLCINIILDVLFTQQGRSNAENSCGLDAGGSGGSSSSGRGVGESSRGLVDSPLKPIKRLRLRGDWSDTGPDARPEGEEAGEWAASCMFTMLDIHYLKKEF